MVKNRKNIQTRSQHTELKGVTQPYILSKFPGFSREL